MSQKDGYFLEHCAVTRSSFITVLLVAAIELPVLMFVIYKVFTLSHCQY